jgi:hypothetical protein
MDFRDAAFKVGGEGGSLAGGGGSGGELTIIGLAKLPPALEEQATIDLRGGDGQAPGAGGGGGGGLSFEGRPATESDVATGLQVPLFFPANAIEVANKLLYVLGRWLDVLRGSAVAVVGSRPARTCSRLRTTRIRHAATAGRARSLRR